MNNFEIIGLILMSMIAIGAMIFMIAISIDHKIKTIKQFNRSPKHNRRFNRSTKRGY